MIGHFIDQLKTEKIKGIAMALDHCLEWAEAVDKGDVLAIKYHSLLGKVSVRDLEVSTVHKSPKGNKLVGGYCHKAKAYRTFLLDRIEVADDKLNGRRIINQKPRKPEILKATMIGVTISASGLKIEGRK